jgi:hypothetical protein
MRKFYFLSLILLLTSANLIAQTVLQPVNQKSEFYPIIKAAQKNISSQTGSEGGKIISTEQDVRMPAPANDNCSGGLAASYTLVPDAACTQGVTTQSGTEAGETYGCITPNPTYTVWYSFVADATNMYVSVSGISGSLCSVTFGLRVYRYTGACPPASGNAVGCVDDATTYSGNIYSTTNLTGLTVGATYMVQITQENCLNSTLKFCVEVGHPTVCTTCSSTCGPECYYPSSSPPTVAWLNSNCPLYPLRPPMNENDTRTMCFTFTAPNSTVSLQLGNTTYCSGGTYAFTWACYNSTCGTAIATGSYSPTTITGLTTGQNYILCYSWTAACSWVSTWPYIYATNQLPIELVSFNAKPNRSYVDVQWTTSSEINTSYFMIERTINGQDFTEIGRLKGGGNSTSLINYRIKDLNPVEGNNYYRMTEVDVDGKVSSGELVAARFSRTFHGLSIIPNPAETEIGINFESGKNTPVTISVMDTKGIIVLSKNILSINDGLNDVPFNISSLTPGIYSVQLVTPTESQNARFVKQ